MRKGVNIYLFLTRKVLLAAGTLLAMQLAFFLCNLRMFHLAGWSEAVGIVWGNLVFTAATVGAFFAPYLAMMLIPLTRVRWRRWYRTVAEALYVVPMLLILVPRGCNAAYFQFTHRLLSDEIFSYLAIGGQMGSLAPLFITDYWYGWAIPLALTAVFLLLNHRIRLKVRLPYMKHLGNDILGFAVGAAMVAAMAMAVKSPADAARYCQPKNTALVNNDAYNILRTAFTPDLTESGYLGNEEAARLYPATFTAIPHDSDNVVAAGHRNVVLIIVESLGQEYMGCYNRQAGADTRTPFLDSLAQHCYLYDGRANGKKSIEGITAINTGIPNLMYRPFTNSAYDGNNYIGLPTILKQAGYRCAFYHGTYNGVMDFDRVCEKIGFEEYLGKNEYEAVMGTDPHDYDGAWGILDEPFLQYTVKHIGETEKPFFAEVFTVSSHHPYPIPEKYKDRFHEGKHPILKCVEYTDFALRRFFEEARLQEWFDSTIIIITGDHSGQGLTREYNDYDGWYRIPMMVYDPQHPEGKRSPRIVQQTDIYPTVVDMLGIQDTFVCFGTSVLQQPQRGYQVYFGNGYYCLVTNDMSNPEKHNIAVIQGDHEEGGKAELRYLKALIQQYNKKIINNELTITP